MMSATDSENKIDHIKKMTIITQSSVWYLVNAFWNEEKCILVCQATHLARDCFKLEILITGIKKNSTAFKAMEKKSINFS